MKIEANKLQVSFYRLIKNNASIDPKQCQRHLLDSSGHVNNICLKPDSRVTCAKTKGYIYIYVTRKSKDDIKFETLHHVVFIAT